MVEEMVREEGERGGKGRGRKGRKGDTRKIIGTKPEIAIRKPLLSSR